MKNKLIILLCAIVVVSVISCGQTPQNGESTNIPNTPAVSTPPETPVTVVPPAETPVPPEPIEPKTWSGFETKFYQLWREPYEGDDPCANARIVRSQTEFLPLYEGLVDNNIEKMLSEYDDSYFEDHTLVLVSYVYPKCMSSPIVHSAELTKDEDGIILRLEVTVKTNNYVPDEQVHSFIALSIKDEIDIDASEKIEVYFNDFKMS